MRDGRRGRGREREEQFWQGRRGEKNRENREETNERRRKYQWIFRSRVIQNQGLWFCALLSS